MAHPFSFNESQFNRLFPFYILINRDLQVIALGKSIRKLCDLGNGKIFNQLFSIPRPLTPIQNINDLVALENQMVVLESATSKKFLLRGQFEFLTDTNEIMFVGSPWFGSMEQVRENNLGIDDFAKHDPLIDLLHVLKSQEITNEDLKQLILTINKQKKELQKADKEVHDIALFPTQNPDPLIRINFRGDLLRNNPAAAKLDFFEYEKKTFRNDEFFKLISEKIDKENPRWGIEARSGNRDYSFVCVTMKDEEYINIYGRDITQQKKDRLQLERLSLVARANENGVLFTTPDGYITWANEGFCKLIGFTQEEVIGKSPIELCKGPLTDETTLYNLLGSFFKGEGFSTEIIYYRKDKRWFWGRSVSQPIKNENGEITEFFGIIQDVTDEKASQEKLKVLSQIAEDNINAVVIADSKGRITWVNRSFIEMTGYSLEEAIGKKPGHLLQGPDTDKNTVEYLRKQVNNGEPFNTEIINYSKTGNKYWLRVQGQPIKNEKGELTGFFALEEDITKEKESESRFMKALENIGDNVWEHNFKTGRTYFSKPENEFLGYKTDELTNDSELWWNSVLEEDRHLLIENDKKYTSGEIDAHSLEYRIRYKDGSIKWVLDRGVVIEKDRNGKPQRITGIHTDITKIKNTEAELDSRVKQLQFLSENVPGVIYEYEFRKDGTDGIRYVSPAIERIFGIKQDDFKNYLNYIHPDDQGKIIEKNIYCLQTLEEFSDESRLIVPGRPHKWISVHSSFSYQTEEENKVFTGFILDITERKYVEQKLEIQRKFYEDILNNMPADIAVFSPAHEYLFVNPMGIKDAELRKWIIGKRDEDYCQYRNKPLNIAEGRRDTFNSVVEAKMPKEWEEKYIAPSGDEQYILRRLFPVLDKEGNVTLVIGYGIDITVRKKFEEALRTNEEKYRSIIANMNLGLMELSTDLKISYANQTMFDMARVPVSPEKIVGFDSTVFLTKESQEIIKQKTENRRKGRSEAYEIQVKLKDELRWWLVSSAPRYNDAGEYVGSIVICLDINDQKKLENELIKSREQAEQLGKAKETFLANMSHEIRTPMNAIIGMGNQLAKTNLTQQQNFYLNTINTAAENLLVIINDILDLSKIEAGKLSLEQIGFEPEKVYNNALRILTHKAEEKGVKLTKTFFDSRLSPVLIGDPYRLTQVLLNLLSNAIKFTEKGSVDITCEVIHETATTQTIKTNVIDTGRGMDQDFVEKLFEKFSQEYESVSRRYGGTGLGMSICKELVELMEGKIEVSSKKDKGTTVSFTIEFNKGNQTDLPENVIEKITNNFLKNKTILVADDNDMNRLVAATILENYGATIIEATNGEEALYMLDKNKTNLVLMDIQMPVLNGYEAANIIRKKGNQVPVIALTANAIKGENQKCIEAGMNDYIAKPFKEEEFLKKIAHWLNSELVIGEIDRTDESLTESPLYDLSGLKEISRDNQAFIEKMVNLFCTQSPAMVVQMKEAFTSGKLDVMGAIAHKLKPSIDNLKINSLKQVIRIIENAGKEKNRTEELPSLIELTEVVINKAIQKMKQEIPG